MNKETQWLLREKYHGEKTAGFFTDCQRLAAGEPLGYVIGHVPFLNCTIYLDSHPLIPRPETEYWVEQAIEKAKKYYEVVDGSEFRKRLPQSAARSASFSKFTPVSFISVLDLCAGSGAVGIAVAKALPQVQITFGEIDPSHLPIIKKNCEINELAPLQYKIIESDLFENISDSYDFILTNPPYIDAAANTVDQSVAVNEPHLALFGGVDGMEIIERIIVEGKTKLSPHGQLWIEHEPFQSANVAEIAIRSGFNSSTHKDQYGIERYSVLVLQ